MTGEVVCGGQIRIHGVDDLCTSGCLLRFVDQPDIILMLSVAHGLIAREATQRDVVETRGGRRLGRLRTWTTFYESITADVALIWVDPAVVSPEVAQIGALNGEPNLQVQEGQTLRFVRGRSIQSGTVRRASDSLSIDVFGIDWELRKIEYEDHIICAPKVSQEGDSGAIVVDEGNSVVGMVVGAKDYVPNDGKPYSATLVTPIGAILSHSDFRRGRLEIVTQIPPDARSPFA